MASVGVVDAASTRKKDPSESKNRPKKFYFGVFFDGTGNNMIQKEAAKAFRNSQVQTSQSQPGAKVGTGSVAPTADINEDWETVINQNLNKYGGNVLQEGNQKADGDYSNVAILHSVYQGLSPEQFQKEQQIFDVYRYNVYVEGAGMSAINEDTKLQKAGNVKGSAFGKGATGVASLVTKAVNIVKTRLKGFDLSDAEVHFHVFGFSRGATCARLFSHLVVRGAGKALPCESEFKSGDFLHFLDDKTIKSKTVDFLGIYDTVSSIGSNFDKNVADYGLYSPSEDGVIHTFHLCAMDEFRENFAITDIGKAASKGTNAEIYIPGCHSDVGGGYISGRESFFLKYPTNLFIRNPQSRKGIVMELNSDGEALSVLGWYAKEKSSNTIKNHKLINKLECGRFVLEGYNRIPLRMMAERATIDTGSKTFAMEAVNKTRFQFPGGLSKLGAKMVNYSNTATGRSFYFPQDSNYLYFNLRSQYLHFSSTDETINADDLINSSSIMGPSRMKNTICRILYTGNYFSEKKFLCDYNL